MNGTPCPCGNTTYFGPATVVYDDPLDMVLEEYRYVTCRRCGRNLVVGRDVTLEEEGE